MDMCIVIKKTTGRTWYRADSGSFWHTDAPQFQSTVDQMNKANDGKFVFDIVERVSTLKAMPSAMANEVRYCTPDLEDPSFEIEHDGWV